MSMDGALLALLKKIEAVEQAVGHFRGIETHGSKRIALAYTAASDLLSATTLSASTWTAVLAGQSFSLDSATSIVEITVRGAMVLLGTATSRAEAQARVNIDGGTGPLRRLSGDTVSADAADGCNPLGGGSVWVTGLAAGAHTVHVEVRSNQLHTTSMYLRASTQPDLEFLTIDVIEHKV